jgi:hypothetical protein
MWTYTGLRKREGQVWTDNNGIKYPSQWWSRTTNAEKIAVGLVWVDDPVQYDSRFYTGDGTPKALDDTGSGEDLVKGLKSVAIDTVKAQASGLLAPTDWHVVKAAEVTEYTVPSEVTTYRAAVRTASNTIETAINGVADHAAFMALYDVPVDSDGNPTGNAPINDWPDAI